MCLRDNLSRINYDLISRICKTIAVNLHCIEREGYLILNINSVNATLHGTTSFASRS